MHPVHEIDAILLLSLTVAAKRRPADLGEIIAAIALAQDEIPNKTRLSDAFTRMSGHGLIVEVDGGYTLSADAQAMMASQRAKDDTAKKIARLKEHLADYQPRDKHPPIWVSQEQLLAAIQGYKTARNENHGKNLLASKPKPKPVWIPTKELAQGRQHLPPSKRRKP
jgi:hypothetical protein